MRTTVETADDDRSQEEEDQEGADDVEFVEVSALLNEDDGFEYQLPKHQRCACHLLNLIATVGAAKAVLSEGYKKLSFNICQVQCGANVEDPHLQLKKLKMFALSSCCAQMPQGGTPCFWQWKDFSG